MAESQPSLERSCISSSGLNITGLHRLKSSLDRLYDQGQIPERQQ